MPDSFTQKKAESSQSTTLKDAGAQEQGIYDQNQRLGDQQAGNLSQQNALQRMLMNPNQSLQDITQPFQERSQQSRQSLMQDKFGADFMNRFNAGGGTGQGLTPEEFLQYRNAADEMNRDPLEGIRNNPDVIQKLQQQILQNQGTQTANDQMIQRMRDPYGLTQEETGGINKVYDAQQARAMNDLNMNFQDMVTSRGMSRSDTPVSDPLARSMGLMLGDIGGQRSAALLGQGNNNRQFGLQMQGQYSNMNNQQFNNGLNLSQMTPGGLNMNLAPLLNARMAQGTTTGMQTQTPSQFDTMSKGLSMAGSLGAAYMTGGTSLAAPGGGIGKA